MMFEFRDLDIYNFQLHDKPQPINLNKRHKAYIYKLDTGIGDLALHISTKAPKFLFTQEYLAEEMEKQLFPIKTSSYIKTSDNRFYIEILRDNQVYYLYVKRWIVGEEYSHKIGQLKNSAKVLSDIHRVSDTYNINLDGSLANKSTLSESFDSDSVKVFEDYINKFLSQGNNATQIHTWLIRNKKKLIDEREECVSFFKTGIHTHLSIGLLHGDFTPSNVLFDGNDVIGILDLNSVKYDIYLREIVWSALTFAQPKNPFDCINMERFILYIREYRNRTNYREIDNELDYFYMIAVSRCLKIFKNMIKKHMNNTWYLSEYLDRNIANLDFLFSEKSRISSLKNQL